MDLNELVLGHYHNEELNEGGKAYAIFHGMIDVLFIRSLL